MFIIEEPYVSDLLAAAVVDLGLPVLDTPMARRTLTSPPVALESDERFAQLASRPGARIYSNSEDSVRWIRENLPEAGLPRQVSLFKDKVAFRDLLADLYPDYRYAAVDSRRLRDFDPTCLRTPFVVKPAVGFFSLCVHVVKDHAEWPAVAATIERELPALASVYPADVLALDRFIAEEAISGEEFAVDAYFDSEGRPVIVDVYAHLFASDADVSDRVYLTNVDIVEKYTPPALEFLREIGQRAHLADFPVHAELRVAANGAVAPIEVNPLRFGGWCVTDLAHFAYDVNPYRCFLLDERPDWARIKEEALDRTTALIVADLPASVDRSAIEAVDYARFSRRFSQILELRPTDFTHYPVFAFAFVRVPTDDFSELHSILGEDLTSYLRLRPD
jgi:hypothetical protein